MGTNALQQPEGNGRPGPPLCVVLLAKTPGLRFVVRLDWRPMPPIRVCVHSVNGPYRWPDQFGDELYGYELCTRRPDEIRLLSPPGSEG